MLGRRWFLVGGVAFVLALAYAWISLPEGRVPTHWSGTGAPDGWSTKGAFVLQFGAIGVGVSALMLGIAWWFSRSTTLSGLNVPNKEYWTRPENLDRARDMAVDLMFEITGITLLFMATLPPAIVVAARDPRHELPWWSLVAVFAFIIGTLLWVVLILRRWRPPPT